MFWTMTNFSRQLSDVWPFVIKKHESSLFLQMTRAYDKEKQLMTVMVQNDTLPPFFLYNQNGTVVKEANHMGRGVPVNDGWGSGHPSRRRADKCRIAAHCSAPLIPHQEPLATPTSTHTGNRGSASYTGLRSDFNHFHCQVGMGLNDFHWGHTSSKNLFT